MMGSLGIVSQAFAAPHPPSSAESYSGFCLIYSTDGVNANLVAVVPPDVVYILYTKRNVWLYLDEDRDGNFSRLRVDYARVTPLANLPSCG